MCVEQQLSLQDLDPQQDQSFLTHLERGTEGDLSEKVGKVVGGTFQGRIPEGAWGRTFGDVPKWTFGSVPELDVPSNVPRFDPPPGV